MLGREPQGVRLDHGALTHARRAASFARLFVERRMADGQPPEEERLCEQVSRAAGVAEERICEQVSQAAGVQASPAAAGPAAADASPAAAVQTSQPAALGSSHSSDEDRPLCQRRPTAKMRSELPDSLEEDQPLCRRRARRPAAEASESSDEDKPLSQLKKRRRRSSPIDSEEDTPLAQRAGSARLTPPRVETARLVALGVPAERAAGVARFISSLPPHTRTGFELAYAYAAAL